MTHHNPAPRLVAQGSSLVWLLHVTSPYAILFLLNQGGSARSPRLRATTDNAGGLGPLILFCASANRLADREEQLFAVVRPGSPKKQPRPAEGREVHAMTKRPYTRPTLVALGDMKNYYN